MALLPLSPLRAPAKTQLMAYLGIAFFLLLALAGALGLTADSRDSADWKDTVDGVRAGQRY